MAFPKIGMTYEQSKEKLRKLGKDPAIRKSLLNQCRLAEGEKAAQELEKDCSRTGNSIFCGFGNGKKYGCGTWIYKDSKWVSACSP